MDKENQPQLLERLSDSIEQTYASFGLRLVVIGVLKQKGITIFIMDLVLGIQVNKIPKYKDNIALLLGVKSEAINFYIPYKNTSYIGLEVKKDLEFFFKETETEIFEDPNFIKVDRPSKQSIIEDAEFQEAIKLVIKHQKGSASLLQRKLKLGYNKAARYIDEMEQLKILGPSDGASPRQVLI